ncbi:hypothetical protein ACSBR2_038454 [Camellia fascicularis]
MLIGESLSLQVSEQQCRLLHYQRGLPSQRRAIHLTLECEYLPLSVFRGRRSQLHPQRPSMVDYGLSLGPSNPLSQSNF